MTKYLVSLILIVVILQFFRPEKNLSNDRTNDITTKYAVSEDVQRILSVACNDCHSNKTNYPWYAEVQPVAWWLNGHVTEGKEHLNFSNFTSRPIAVQNHKFEEIVEMVEEGEMPLPSYTMFGLHSGANLSAEQRELLISWANASMDSLKNQYPPDSLIMRRR